MPLREKKVHVPRWRMNYSHSSTLGGKKKAESVPGLSIAKVYNCKERKITAPRRARGRGSEGEGGSETELQKALRAHGPPSIFLKASLSFNSP